ncbi:MAG TPA: excinuclease ABC subunit UvrB [Exilispira sp.]|nr:excinuclease ABC subunit UvrB [Exilispira sp.]
MQFKLFSSFSPAGDQPQAIQKIVQAFKSGKDRVTLHGVTGSGKTFTVAHVIEKLQLPTLVISHNKTLAGQLYGELKSFFPENAVEYFVSYFDYYQPEAYLPKRDLYIEKDSDINEEIERLRLKATEALLSRRDVVVVATVSCIYGIGNPDEYKNQRIPIATREQLPIEKLCNLLISIFYERSDLEFYPGKFRIKGDIVDIFPAYTEHALRLIYSGDSIEKILFIHPITSDTISSTDSFILYPAKHFITNISERNRALKEIENEMQQRYIQLKESGKILEAERLRSRTEYDLEMIREIGYVKGIENYSRHFDGRLPGQPPSTLLNYFPDDFLLVIDESHVSIPQLHAMYGGDFSRKKALIDYGFRLPSAFDHRPLKFEEVEKYFKKVLFVSATPSDYETSSSCVVEQFIRPTGLLDPQIIVRPATNQVKDLIEEIDKRITNDERILVLVLTKKNAEDLADYLEKHNYPATYLHSDIESLDRLDLISKFRSGTYKILVGINLLREGIDLPEVTLVAILDADKVGFLRSERSLIQMMGRAARNVNGTIIMYADELSFSMKSAIEITKKRREKQLEYNAKNGITPKSIIKEVKSYIEREEKVKEDATSIAYDVLIKKYNPLNPKEKDKLIKVLTEQMMKAAKNWEFEEAAVLRDRIKELTGKK